MKYEKQLALDQITKRHVFSLKRFLKCNIIEEFYCFILITIEMVGGGWGALAV
jgi:hypothetical protein